MVAFTGEYDGNVDVYVVPTAGGIPRRLTWHPDADVVAGVSPDGKSVLFHSAQNSHQSFAASSPCPWTAARPAELPLPVAVQGSYSPDGKRLAYVPFNQWQRAWKRYRGGQTTPIWIASLADRHRGVPEREFERLDPMWLGDTVYFLSDRDGPVSLYAYDHEIEAGAARGREHGLDYQVGSAGPDAIVYEQFGALLPVRPGAAEDGRFRSTVAGDIPEVRPHYVTVDRQEDQQLRPFARAGHGCAFEAHGEILTVPAEKGDVRNLTRSPGVADRDPAWSPDGQWLAWFSDESGEYALRHPQSERPGRGSEDLPRARRRPSSTRPASRPTARRSPTRTSDWTSCTWTSTRAVRR